MIIPVEAVGQYGIVTDMPYSKIPLNAWTSGRNVRFREGGVEKFSGHVEVFAGPITPPQWLQLTSTVNLQLWLYGGVNLVGATDGTTHADITRASGPYSNDPNIGWTGTIIEDIPVVNNGVDFPQMWNKPALSQKLEDLTNWPPGVTARSLRGLKGYLIALDIGKSGVRFPTMIKWSHRAPQGAVPISWATDDETIDAGEWTLPAEGGFLVDGIRLRDSLMLYKEYETWIMTYSRSDSGVFTFVRKFPNVGLFNRRCAVEFKAGWHFVFTGNDCIVHDGQSVQSVMKLRIRKLIEGKIDSNNGNRSFVSMNFATGEIGVAFPERGQTWPNLMLVWNTLEDIWGLRELPAAGFIESGPVPPPSVGAKWDEALVTWDSMNQLWGERAAAPATLQQVIASPGEGKIYLGGQGTTFNGADMTSFVERTNLGFPLKSQQPPDFTTMKQVIGLWPHIEGSVGGVVDVYLGYQSKVDGPVTYGLGRPYVIGSSDMLDFADSEASRLHSIKFESKAAITWKMSGYDVDVITRGTYG